MLISGLFVLLAARLEPSAIPALGWGVLAVLLGMQLLGRPLAVLVSTLGTALSWSERGLLAWIALRGTGITSPRPGCRAYQPATTQPWRSKRPHPGRFKVTPRG